MYRTKSSQFDPALIIYFTIKENIYFDNALTSGNITTGVLENTELFTMNASRLQG